MKTTKRTNKAKNFEGFVNEMLLATSEEELTNICYRRDGVDQSYQHEELTYQQQETLFKLASELTRALKYAKN